MRTPALLVVVLAPAFLAGCANCCPPPCPTPASPSALRARAGVAQPAAAPASVLRDGTTGLAVGAEAYARVVAGADVVMFGELHGHAEGAKAELALWRAVAAAPDGRPGALALEFFEKDTQADLDAHLAGTLAEADLVKRARQSNAYAATHGPLVAEAKAKGLRVIAANAPRRLVTAYRKQAEPYEAWKAALPEADRAFLPRTTAETPGPYREKFLNLMGPERGPAFFKAQALWDDAMAESVADARAADPAARVLLVVGGFHVADRLGTLEKFAARRPADRVVLVQMATSADAALPLPPDQRGRADLVLVVPEEKSDSAKP
jgi:uncharacterized iron-regulated protein